MACTLPSEVWERQPRGRRRQCGQSKPNVPMGKIIAAGQLVVSQSAPGRPAPGRRIRRLSFPPAGEGARGFSEGASAVGKRQDKLGKYGMLSVCLSCILSYPSVRPPVRLATSTLLTSSRARGQEGKKQKNTPPTSFGETPRRPHPWLEHAVSGGRQAGTALKHESA